MPREFAPICLLLALLLTACGGGGSGSGQIGVPPEVEVRGSVRLQTSLPAELAPESAFARARARSGRGADERAEPNEMLHEVNELGSGLPIPVRSGRIDVGDPGDLWRFGPLEASTGTRVVSFFVDFDRQEAGAKLVATQVRGARALRAQELAGDGVVSLELQPGDQVLLWVTADAASGYGLGASEGHTPSVDASQPLTATARRAHFAERLGVGHLEYAPGEIVVQCDEDADPSALRRLGLELVRKGGAVELWRSPLLAAQLAGVERNFAHAELIRRIGSEAVGFRNASPNLHVPIERLAGLQQQTPNDPEYAKGQWNLPMAGFDKVWSEVRGESKLRIAFIDTGILSDHPDLQPRMSTLGYDFISDLQVASDGDGPDADPSEPRELGLKTLFHGTYVSGVACAATDNALGMAGGTWAGDLMMLRVFGPSIASSFDLVQAYRYCAGLSNVSGRVLKPEERPHVLNMSYAPVSITAAEIAAIQECAQAGIWLFAAVGNDSTVDVRTYPASLPEVMGIGAVGPNRIKTDYSNVGDWVELVAPGGTEFGGPGGVVSAWGGEFKPKEFSFIYFTFLGTSVATPHVSATAALLLAVRPELDFASGRSILQQSAVDLGAPGPDKLYGAGLLQAHAAVALATQAGHRIRTSPAELDLGENRAQLVADVDSAGLFPLENLSVGAISAPAGSVQASLDAVLAPTKLRIAVDRDQVKVGRHEETIELRDLFVRRRVPLRFVKPIPAASAPIVVRLLRGGDELYRTECDANGAFVLPSVALGTYVLEIGVDQNGNQSFGDSQEWYLRQDFVVGPDGGPAPNGTLVPWVD